METLHIAEAEDKRTSFKLYWQCEPDYNFR